MSGCKAFTIRGAGHIDDCWVNFIEHATSVLGSEGISSVPRNGRTYEAKVFAWEVVFVPVFAGARWHFLVSAKINNMVLCGTCLTLYSEPTFAILFHMAWPPHWRSAAWRVAWIGEDGFAEILGNCGYTWLPLMSRIYSAWCTWKKMSVLIHFNHLYNTKAGKKL